jgi:hypothetical protein
MRVIESESVKRKKKDKAKDKRKFVTYWSLVEPKDYAKDMAAQSHGKRTST